MLPVWALAGRRVRATLGARQVPLLALGAAFCFTIMMFNIPALGGTTAHPVAGTLLAVMLGPWAAVIGMSVALAIQALFFGDGGLLTFGANCFAMAFVLPFVGYSVYHLFAGRHAPDSSARALCAALGAYFGINAAAAVVAVLLGIQPALFHTPNGDALYFPFGLKVTLPAMLGTHLLVAGPAEAIVTGLVVRYLQAARIPLYGAATPEAMFTASERTVARRGRRREALWIGLLALIALSPLGLLASGEAWGEWDAQGVAEQIKAVEGKEYVPAGIARAEEHGYKGLRGLEDYASERGSLGYIGAGILGVGAILLLLFVGGRMLVAPPPKGKGSEADAFTLIPGPSPSEGEGSQTSTSAFSPRLNREESLEFVSPLPSEERAMKGEGPGVRVETPGSGGVRGEVPGVRAIPDWLRRPSDETVPPPDLSGKPPNAFIERTLGEIAANAAATLYGEKWTRQAGYLQRLDPRAKVLAFLGLIAVTACVHNFVTLALLYALTLTLALVSRLPAGMLLKRVWLSVPIFVGAIALPAAFNIVTPGRALLVLWREPYLALTVPGFWMAATLMLRVGVAVSLAALLTLTTPWNDLLRALRMLLVPRLFVGVLAMTYRYVAVLLQTAAEMFVARRSRTVGRATNAEGRLFVGAAIGSLFGKTLSLADEVHAAMLSRGFQGEMRTLTRLQWSVADSAWILAIALVAGAALKGG